MCQLIWDVFVVDLVVDFVRAHRTSKRWDCCYFLAYPLYPDILRLKSARRSSVMPVTLSTVSWTVMVSSSLLIMRAPPYMTMLAAAVIPVCNMLVVVNTALIAVAFLLVVGATAVAA